MGTSKVRETAWAGNLEAKLKRGEDDSTRITVGCNLMRHRRDTNVTGSAQAQFSMTKGTAGFAKATINTKGTGQVNTRRDRLLKGSSNAMRWTGCFYGRHARGVCALMELVIAAMSKFMRCQCLCRRCCCARRSLSDPFAAFALVPADILPRELHGQGGDGVGHAGARAGRSLGQDPRRPGLLGAVVRR